MEENHKQENIYDKILEKGKEKEQRKEDQQVVYGYLITWREWPSELLSDYINDIRKLFSGLHVALVAVDSVTLSLKDYYRQWKLTSSREC